MPNLVEIHPVLWPPNPNKQTNRQTDRQTDKHLSFVYIDFFVCVNPPAVPLAWVDPDHPAAAAFESVPTNLLPHRPEKKKDSFYHTWGRGEGEGWVG